MTQTASGSITDHVHPEIAMSEQALPKSKTLHALVKGTPILTAAAVACGCVYVGLNNPEEKLVLGKCGFYALTGYYCPGCGMTRALHSLLKGDVLRAIQFNLVFVIAVPILIYFYVWWVNWAFTQKKMPTFKVSRRAGWTVIALLLIFIVGRNLPFDFAHYFSRGRI
ncbi:MAG: DUF2752 domain-containing protein [Acidimicrobiia bacterium]